MASVGHIAVGIVAARAYHEGRVPRWSSMAIWSAVSMLPDADVVGFGLGVEYADPWGHRGATHSLPFVIALGLTIGFVAGWFKRPVARTAVVAIAVLASHGLLDTMTDGGLGCALLWPFDLTRYFAPWRPIPVAPIGLSFFSLYGLTVSLTELLLFSPLFVWALRSRRMPPKFVGAGIAAWAASVWLIASRDPVHERMVGLVVREDTDYATGFSEQAFRTVEAGQSETDVKRLLGPPIREDWYYDTPGNGIEMSKPDRQPGCWNVRFEDGTVVKMSDRDACNAHGIDSGMTPAVVAQRIGPPLDACWQYTRSPSHRTYRLRAVCVSKGKVTEVIRQWIADP